MNKILSITSEVSPERNFGLSCFSVRINLWSFIYTKLRYHRDDQKSDHDECPGVLPCILTHGRTVVQQKWEDETPPVCFCSV